MCMMYLICDTIINYYLLANYVMSCSDFLNNVVFSNCRNIEFYCKNHHYNASLKSYDKYNLVFVLRYYYL